MDTIFSHSSFEKLNDKNNFFNVGTLMCALYVYCLHLIFPYIIPYNKGCQRFKCLDVPPLCFSLVLIKPSLHPVIGLGLSHLLLQFAMWFHFRSMYSCLTLRSRMSCSYTRLTLNKPFLHWPAHA